MAQKGKTQLMIIFTAPADLVSEGDRLFASHADWMAKSHHKDGPLALLSYNVGKGAELANPLDPSSSSTGNTSYVLHEVYESQAGLDDHWRMSSQWSEMGALLRGRASARSRRFTAHRSFSRSGSFQPPRNQSGTL